jgi:hypothetical protein
MKFKHTIQILLISFFTVSSAFTDTGPNPTPSLTPTPIASALPTPSTSPSVSPSPEPTVTLNPESLRTLLLSKSCGQ